MKHGFKDGFIVFTILIWGGLWGVVEATVGYVLHLLPFSVGWLIWYPLASFFMFQVYRKTGRAACITLVGILSASIKLFNLFLPVSIDRVLNPACSILFESITMAAAVFLLSRFFADRKNHMLFAVSAVLCMNTGWRTLYSVYLLVLVPDWMREISVVSNTAVFMRFFIVDNFFTSLVLIAAIPLRKHTERWITLISDQASRLLSSCSCKAAARLRTAAAICLLGGSIALQILL